MTGLPAALLVILGFGLVILIIVDFFGTTLMPSSVRFIGAMVATYVWRLFVLAAEGTGRPRLRELAGPVIIVTVFATWVLLTWIAWTVIFVSDRSAVLEAVSGQPANFWERVYYVGFTLSTLGVGDYKAGDDLSRILTAIASFAGITIVTLTIANLISITGAVTSTRALAAQLTSLGESGEEILINGWDGETFEPLTRQLTPLLRLLFEHSERAEASPVINHFVSLYRRTAIAPAVAALDDALLLLRKAVAPEARPHGLHLDPFLEAIRAVVPELTMRLPTPPPPIPATGRLQATGIPLGADDPGSWCDERDRKRRAALAAWLRESGWLWGPPAAHAFRRVQGAKLRRVGEA